MDDDTGLLFDLPSVGRKKVSAAFDGGRITSDGGVALLALADRRIGIVDRLAALIADTRDPALVTHSVGSILRARVLAIASGYEDGNDLARLRGDPAFKLAWGRLPDSGGDLCSQPTVSRWENAPDLKTVIRLTYAMVDAWCASYGHEPGLEGIRDHGLQGSRRLRAGAGRGQKRQDACQRRHRNPAEHGC